MSVRSESPYGACKRSDWIVPATASTNSSALTAESAKPPTGTKPATDESSGVYVFSSSEIVNSTLLNLAFLLTAADNVTATANVWGWHHTGGGTYIPKLLAVLSITAGARTGATGLDIADTDYIADTITATTDHTVRTVKVWTATDGLSFVEIDHGDSDLIEVEVKVDTATSVKPIARGM